jgi:hypothetical protein
MSGRLLSGDVRSNLGLSSKSIVHQWSKQPGNVTSIPNFSKNYETVAKMSRNLKRVGYVGMALTVGDSVANIQQACTVGDAATCSKAKYIQGGKAVGSVGGGYLGGALAYVGCNILFGIESAGTSLFWCSLVAGSGAGYLGGNYGGSRGELLGNEIYKSKGIK